MADSQNSVNNGTVNANFVARRNVDGAGTVSAIGAVHTDTTNAASTGFVFAQATAASGADAFINCILTATRSWGWGIDASDSAALKETTFPAGSTDPSTGILTRKVTVGGVQTMPLQPAFFALLTGSTGGVTGNLGLYILGNNGGGTLTVVTDQGSNTSFPGGDFTFTAPVTGFYKFGWQLVSGAYTAAMTSCGSTIRVNATPYQGMIQNPFATQNGASSLITAQEIAIGLSLGDAVTFRFQAAGGAGDTVAILNTNNGTYVYGHLIA